MTVKKYLPALCAAWAAVAGGEVRVGDGEIYRAAVPGGETHVLAERLSVTQGAQGLVKQGAGTWVLPETMFLFDTPLNLVTAEGCTELQLTPAASVAASVAAPEALLARAALWFDASKADSLVTQDVAAEGGTAQAVMAWRDAREAASAETRVYAQAESRDDIYPGEGRWPLLQTVEGRAAVYFGRVKSGRYMVWTDPAGATHTLSGIETIFAVMGVADSWGYLIGAADNVASKVASASDAPVDLSAIPLWARDSCFAFGGTFINGRQVDGYSGHPQSGFQLVEIEMPSWKFDGANAFFNGGDWLCEVVIFTESLSASERQTIADYLMDKWHLGGTSPRARTLQTAPGAATVVSVAEGTVFDAALQGEGEVVKAGAATAFVQPAPGDETYLAHAAVTPRGGASAANPALVSSAGGVPFNGRVRVTDGTLYLNDAITVSAADGTALEAAVDVQGNRVRASSAAGGTIVKRGNGTLALDTVPDETRKVSVEAGTLALRAVRTAEGASVSPRAGVSVEIPNAGFEEVEYVPDKSGNNEYYRLFNEETYNGWTGENAGEWNCFVGISGLKDDGTAGTAYNAGYDLPPPHSGRGQLNIQCTASAYTTIEIPVDGIYELSFWLGGSEWDRKNQLSFAVEIETAGGEKIEIGRLMRPSTRTYRAYRFRTPYLAAGAGQKLRFRNLNQLSSAIVIDDVALSRVCAADDSRRVALPNGGCENYTLPLPQTWFDSGVEKVEVPHWRFDQPVGWSDGDMPRVSLMHATYGQFDTWLTRPGDAAIVFEGADGAATLTNVTLGAGTYALRAQLAYRYVDKMDRSDGTLQATISSGGETLAELGTVTCGHRAFASHDWPQTFTLAAEATVDIRVTSTTKTSVFADDFELVRLPTANRLVNGGFETGTLAGWTLEQAAGVDPSEVYKYGDWTDEHFSQAYYEGQYCCALRGPSTIRQTVAFDRAGVYRFRFAEHVRSESGVTSLYGLNPVRVWCRNASGETQEIGRTLTAPAEAVNREFVRHDFLFRIDAPGEWEIGLTGLCETGDHNAILDDLSVTPVDAAAYEATPAIGPEVELAVARGARLRLDFDGTLPLGSLRLNGVRRSGEISARDYPEYLAGPGVLSVKPLGMKIIIR